MTEMKKNAGDVADCEAACWVELHGFCTPGGDPVWACGSCGEGQHVYGIEHRGNYTRICPDCGVVNYYPWELLPVGERCRRIPRVAVTEWCDAEANGDDARAARKEEAWKAVREARDEEAERKARSRKESEDRLIRNVMLSGFRRDS